MLFKTLFGSEVVGSVRWWHDLPALEFHDFYNPYIPGVLEELGKQGLIEESEGACKDGGFNYASTDLAALCRMDNPCNYVGQREHFEMFFTTSIKCHAAKRVGWLPAGENMYPKTNHVGFGLVLGEDGKRFQTRNTEVVRLIDLLDKAKSRCKAALVERGKADKWTEEELDQTAEAVGYGAVNNFLVNYSANYSINSQQITLNYLVNYSLNLSVNY
ncbi:hypothetical protein CsSME_00007742 [Camellia sinensis var. sinensis]